MTKHNQEEPKYKVRATDIYSLFTITDKDIERFQEIYYKDFGEAGKVSPAVSKNKHPFSRFRKVSPFPGVA